MRSCCTFKRLSTETASHHQPISNCNLEWEYTVDKQGLFVWDSVLFSYMHTASWSYTYGTIRMHKYF